MLYPKTKLTKQRLKRGAFVGVVNLHSAINPYATTHDPNSFRSPPPEG